MLGPRCRRAKERGRRRGAPNRADCRDACGPRCPVGSEGLSTTRPTARGSARWRGLELTDDAFVLAVPNDFTREWIEGHFLEPDPRRGARRDRPRAADPARRSPRAEARRAAPTRSSVHRRETLSAGLNPKYTFDLVRDRLVEPLRARGRARRRRGAGAGVQPALHLRRHRARQDAPAAGDRAVRQRAPGRAVGALRDERDVHERLHQLAPRQAHRGLQAALPQLRRAADRRRPVLRAQGADPGGVLPHVQLALRGRQPDRDLVRPAAARDRDPRGAAALALRVGADHRHPAARPRDAHRDPAQEGEDRRDPRRPTRRC